MKELGSLLQVSLIHFSYTKHCQLENILYKEKNNEHVMMGYCALLIFVVSKVLCIVDGCMMKTQTTAGLPECP